MRHPFRLLGIAAMALLCSAPAHAIVIQFSAELGNFEEPPTGSPGTGFVLVTIDTVLHTMSIEASFSGLTSPTTVAHIHCCTALPEEGNIGVATTTPTFPGFPAGVTSGTYNNTFDLTALTTYNASFVAANGGTAAGAEAGLIKGMEEKKAYFNVHTEAFGGGEIRGFLVPEPTTIALLGAGLLGLAGLHRRRISG
jgi:hypothetical protein